MLEIAAVEPLENRSVWMTLSDGTVVVERITLDDAAFREVSVDYGTLAWPGDIDLAPETLIWDGPYPGDERRRPEPFLRPRKPDRPRA